jgi:hypothetical protein
MGMYDPFRRPASTPWDAFADDLRRKLPPPNPGIVEAYVSWGPWMHIIFGALGLIGAFSALNVFGGLVLVIHPFVIMALIELVSSAAQILGGLLMRGQRLSGWWLAAIGLVIGGLLNLAHLNLIGLAFSVAIGYIHLIAKPAYR